MGDFKDIEIKGIIEEGITEPRNYGSSGSALYAIPFELSDTPPPEWVNLFITNWKNPQRATTMHRPGIARISGGSLVLDGTTLEEVEKCHLDTLMLVIEKTNQDYRQLLLEQEEERQRDQVRREERRRQIAEGVKRIKFD